MPVGNRQAFDIEITLKDGPNGTDGTVFGVMLETHVTSRITLAPDLLPTPIEGDPKSLQQLLVASDADTPLSEQLEPVVTDDWSGGVGVSYAAAEGVYTRTQGYALPAGTALDVVLEAAHNTNSPCHAFCEFLGDLYIAQFGDGTAGSGRVMKLAGGTGAPANWPLALGVSEYVLDLQVFNDGAGTQYLYACSNNLSGLNGRLHRTSDGVNWTSTDAPGTGTGHDFGTHGRYRLTKWFAQTTDGTEGWRLATISGARTLAYTIPNADPFRADAWVEGINVESTQRLQHLVGSRRRVFAAAPGEAFAIDEQGQSHDLRSYSAQTILPGVGGSFDPGDVSIMYADGYIYARLGTGLDRIPVDTEMLQETPEQCGPGWGTPAENHWSGFVTCLYYDQGYVVAAVWSPNTSTSAIFWGNDKRHYPSEIAAKTRNSLIWHGPEVVGNQAYRVMRMHISGLTGAGGGLRLWISSLSSGGVPALSWVSIPEGGSPLQDLLGSGPHRYANGAGLTSIWQPWSRLYGLPQMYGSRESTKHVYQNVVGTRGLGSGTKLTQYTRADAAPGSNTWPTGVDITTSPNQSVAPAAQVSGSRIEQRTDFFAPSGAATPPVVPVLEQLRTTAWRVAPDMDTWELRVQYGSGVLNRNNGSADPKLDPLTIYSYLHTAAQSAPITIRDPRGDLWHAKVLQVAERSVQVHTDGSGQTVTASIKLAGVTGPL